MLGRVRRSSPFVPVLARLACASFASCAFASPAGAEPRDPALRGLDVFIHGAPKVVAGDVFSVDLRTYGFPSVATAEPLAGATVVAAWDPESLGPISNAPPEVTVTTGSLGEAKLDIPAPPGDPRKLVLLVSIRHGSHARTQKIEVTRLTRTRIELHVADPLVVPGSDTPAWVVVTDSRTGRALPNTEVDLALREGSVDRQSVRVTTDVSGYARATLFVPPGVSGTPPLSIHARVGGGPPAPGRAADESSLPLGLREETPATPQLTLRWREQELKPGEVGHAAMDVTDAAGEPIANQRLQAWIGPKGTTPPASDAEWAKNGKELVTDGLGHASIELAAPKVVTAHGSDLIVVARTEVEGRKLEEKRTVPVGLPVANATLEIEGSVLVPGLAQRAFLHVDDGEHGVAGEFEVTADGLRARATTDARGDAEVTWTVPADVGAARQTGPCAGGVAAAVQVRAATPVAALSRHPEPFELCVRVDRERTAILRPSVEVARVGEHPRVAAIATARAARPANAIASVVDRAPDGYGRALWTTAASPSEVTLDLTGAAPGVHEITFAVPRPAKDAEIASTRMLVVPQVLPKLSAKLAGGRLAPGGEAEVDVTLGDGHGAALTGEVTAVIVDKEGGGDLSALERLDTRRSLCRDAGAFPERCDAFLEGDASKDGVAIERRAALTARGEDALAPLADPAAHATAQLTATFSSVLHSLEGAVFQAETPESLRDVRRKGPAGGWTFNPELMTLVTSAMGEPPTTPGGEPFGLGDLIAIDRQVTFDNVARRVTRLKIFNLLAALRSFKQEQQVDADEPILADPNALLRRLVRAEKITEPQLLDPWGGTIQFVKSGGASLPFLGVARGWSLQSPGPDGRPGTGDDVRDPFERVVASKSPYARAMGEDEIVDARLDMRVGDATVSSWQEMFARLTGTALGHGEGTGTGQGFGSGHGRLGGSHTTRAPSIRQGRAIASDSTRWTAPVRTDAQGHARIKVPLGEYETTWRIALVGRTDAGQTAVSAIDAPAFLPLSARVDVGSVLTVGDEVAARIAVRNRTATARAVTLDVVTEGDLAAPSREPRTPATLRIEVPANAVRSVFTRVIARAVGRGTIRVTVRAGGEGSDQVAHEVSIEPAGEPRVLATVLAATSHSPPSTLRIAAPPGYALRGAARLVVEAGVDDALLGALNAVEPDSRLSPDALADAIEVAARVEKVAESEGKRWLVTRARKTAAFARGYLEPHVPSSGFHVAAARATLFPPPAPAGGVRKLEPTRTECPSDAEVMAAPLASFLEAEPPPSPTGPLPCFTLLAGKADPKTPLDLARAVLALADRPHRAPMATSFAHDLARQTRADAETGPVFDGTRAERAIVVAALARTAFSWSRDPRASERMLARLLSLRDAGGGYGSSEATRDAVRAIVAVGPASEGLAKRARIGVVERGGRRHVLDVLPNGSTAVALGAQTTEVTLDFGGSPAVARLERPALRSFLAPPDTSVTPIRVAADWPNDARAGTTGIVHLTFTNSVGHDVVVWTRVPLPPGVTLAAPVPDVVLRQGVAHVRTTVGTTTTVALPVRFTLPGRVLVREAETNTTSEEQPRALTPARMLTVSP